MLKNLLILFALTIAAQSSAKVAFDPVRNYTKEETKVLKVSTKLANELFGSSCFSEFVVKKRKKLIKTNGLSRIETVNHLKNADLTVPVKMYHKKSSGVIGRRFPPNPEVQTNRKFHSGANACARGSNLTHEWSHSLGYGHNFKASYNRQFSVPYTINAAFLACCECVKRTLTDCKILPRPKKVKKKVCKRNWKWAWFKKKCIRPR